MFQRIIKRDGMKNKRMRKRSSDDTFSRLFCSFAIFLEWKLILLKIGSLRNDCGIKKVLSEA